MMKKKILVVDDDPIVRTILVKMLRVRDIEVIEANQGFLAAKIFEKHRREVSLIISDVQMPVLDGIELLKRVRQTSSCAFILFTGLSDVIESKAAFELGATDFITKPIDKEAIRKIVAHFEAAESGDQRELTDRVPDANEYRKVQIEDLLFTDIIQTDIFIRLSENKFVKVGRAGEKTPRERLKFYQDKKIDFLYVLTTAFGAYVEAVAETSHSAMQNRSISQEAKLALLETSTRLIAENAFLAPELDRKSLQWTQTVLEDTIDFAAKDPALFDQLTDLAKHSNHLYAHSLGVSLYASLLAREHGWTSPQTLNKVALGGLFHDIGKKELDPALLAKPRKNQTPEDIRLIESHCDRGRDILLGIAGLPEDVALIALHHHETKTGTGYPRRLKGEQINPLARMIFVVDKFMSFLLPAVPGETPLSTVDAIKKMQTFYDGDLDPAFFKSLIKILGLPAGSQSKAS